MKLSAKTILLIEKSVDKLFDRVKTRLTGRIHSSVPKGVIVTHLPELSIPGLFKLAAKIEGTKPNEQLLESLVKISGSYVEAVREKAKAKVVHEVGAFLADAAKNGVETDIETVLGGQLSELFGTVSNDLKRIVESETTIARNMSLVDSITKVNLSAGIRDPYVYFVVVRDNSLCSECVGLHLCRDKTTPRVWKLSEVGSGYHKKGQSNPKAGGLHPHCRCVIQTLLPGYGFDSSGMTEYKSPGWNEYEHQKANGF